MMTADPPGHAANATGADGSSYLSIPADPARDGYALTSDPRGRGCQVCSIENATRMNETADQDATPGATDDAARARTVDESRVVMGRIMQPPDANSWGNVHGGAIMYLVDEAGGAAAIRHSRCRCVTVAMDSMVFKEPVYIGDLLTIHACVTWVGKSSIEVETQIDAENMMTGQVRRAGMSHLIYVAIDEDGRPTQAPPLLLRTDEERARWRAAEERRARRRS